MSVEYLSPKNSGSATADAEQLQNALAKGGIVHLGPGTFRGSIVIDGNSGLRGLGERTVLACRSGPAVRVNSGQGVETHNVTLDDFIIDCENAGTYGLVLGQVSASPFTGTGKFRRLTIKRATEAALHMVYQAYASFQGCHFTLSKYGIHFDKQNSNANTTTTFRDCRVNRNTEYGLFMENGLEITFDNVCFETNGKEGCYLLMPDQAVYTDAVFRSILFTRCYWELNNLGRSGSGWFQFNSGNSGAAIFQYVSLEKCIFTSAESGDFHAFCGKGRLDEANNEWANPLAGALQATSSAAFIQGRNERAPSEYMTVGSAVTLSHEQVAGGRRAFWHNNSGTPAKVIDMQDGQKLGFYGATPIVKPTVVAGDATSLETALINLGLIKY